MPLALPSSPAPMRSCGDCGAFVRPESRRDSINGSSSGCNDADGIWPHIRASFSSAKSNTLHIQSRLETGLCRRVLVAAAAAPEPPPSFLPLRSLSPLFSAGESRLKGCGTPLCLHVYGREKEREWVGSSLHSGNESAKKRWNTREENAQL